MSGFKPQPGPQAAGNYPFVGPNYQMYGEQPGFIYYPPHDWYYDDPKYAESYAEEKGYAPEKPKQPGLKDTLLPIGAGALALGGGQQLGQALTSGASNLWGLGSGGGAGAGSGAATAGGAGAAGGAASGASGAGGLGAMDLAASAPFSFGSSGAGAAGAAPAAPSIVGAGSTGASGAGAGAGTGMLGAAAVPLGAAAVGAYYAHYGSDAYDKIKNNEKKDEGYLQAALMSNPYTAWLAPFTNKLGLKSGKHEDQVKRDRIRSGFKEAGIVDDDYNLVLPDGTSFNIGFDGRAKLGEEGSQRGYYDVDLNDADAVALIGDLDPLGAILGAGNEKATSDITGWFVNAVSQSNDKQGNVLGLYQQLGFDHQGAWNAIDALEKEGQLSTEKADAYKNGVDRVFGVGAYSDGKQPQQQQQQVPEPETPQPDVLTATPQVGVQTPQTPRPQPQQQPQAQQGFASGPRPMPQVQAPRPQPGTLTQEQMAQMASRGAPFILGNQAPPSSRVFAPFRGQR